MDRKETIRERRRRKKRQMLIRKYMRLGVYAVGAILLLVFVVNGIIRPIMNRGKNNSEGVMVENLTVDTSSYTDTTAQAETAEAAATEQTASEETTETAETAETTEAVSTGTATSSGTSGDNTTIGNAKRVPLRGANDTEKLNVLTPGWHDSASGRWYQNADGTYYANGFREIDGSQYCFDSNGHLRTGWVTSGVNDYYFNEDGTYDPSQVRPMLCLTFDDGPGDYTAELLDILEENNAKATFLMLGEMVVQHPELPARMLELGCELGNHSYNHPDLTTLSLDDVVKQYADTDQELINACGQASTVCRAPYGSANMDIYNAVGKPFAMWSLDTLDWKTRDADMDYDAVINGDLTDGSIILMHDIHQASVEACKRIIPELINRGYRLVTFSEMAEAKNVTLQNDLYIDFWPSSLEAGRVAGYNGEKSLTE